MSQIDPSFTRRPFKLKKRWILLFILVIALIIACIPEIVHVNEGESISIGSARDGKLENGWLMPSRGTNFRYFSLISYYLVNAAYVNSSIYKVLTESYVICESTCPGREFVLMECTNKHGGDMLFHWTHENGTSADFMVPKKRGSKQKTWLDQAGLFHYLLKFDASGRAGLDRKIEIDFETMARHLLALDDAAKRNGVGIRRILFHSDLQDDLYRTSSGRELKKRDLNMPPHLRELINRFHDDHYHVDFDLSPDGR